MIGELRSTLQLFFSAMVARLSGKNDVWRKESNHGNYEVKSGVWKGA